jgi:nicotinate dehydrogenase subunit A
LLHGSDVGTAALSFELEWPIEGRFSSRNALLTASKGKSQIAPHVRLSQFAKCVKGIAMPETFRVHVNGAEHAVTADGDTPLLYILRNDLGLNGSKLGCGLAQCGACMAIVGDEATRTCVFPLSAVGDAPVVTLEGLGTVDKPHPRQKAFIAEQAAQCGYCINGMIMTAKALLDRNQHPTSAEIREALAQNLCRCGTHLRIIRAVQRAAKET